MHIEWKLKLPVHISIYAQAGLFTAEDLGATVIARAVFVRPK